MNDSAYTGNGVIKIIFDECNEILNAGSVTNGIVSLQLPSNVPDECLVEIATDMPPSFTLNPRNAKTAQGYFILEDNEEMKIGDLYISSSEDNHFLESIEYTYSPQNGSLTGNVKFNEGGLEVDFTMNMAVKSGWNKIYDQTTINMSAKTSTIKQSTDNVLTKEVKWYLN